jgi:hypothetical protein
MKSLSVPVASLPKSFLNFAAVRPEIFAMRSSEAPPLFTALNEPSQKRWIDEPPASASSPALAIADAQPRTCSFDAPTVLAAPAMFSAMFMISDSVDAPLLPR